MISSRQSFSKATFITILYTLLVIAWGAFVRISHSGDGCGEHWPLCQGSLIPQGETAALIQTWVEFFHRVKSGVLGIIIAALTLWSIRIFPKSHPARMAAYGMFFFTFTEALLGAWLVLGGYVDRDASLGRVVLMGGHLLNTLLLLASMYTLWFTSRLTDYAPQRLDKNYSRILFGIGAAILILASTGVWAALASTLFPSESITAGITADLSSDSHILVRLRIIHPIAAILLAVILYGLIQKLPGHIGSAKRRCTNMLLLTLFIGASTLFLLSPTSLKLLHLLSVDLLWLSFINLYLSLRYNRDSSG